MASIGGLTSSTSSSLSSTSSLRGYGGLASGLDRDSLIESMTYGTRSKIAAQNQKVQSLQWQQTSMQSITSKLYEFANKYTSYASSSNLTSSKLFSRNQVTPSGENSKYLSVSGSGLSADTISVLGVKSLAQTAQMSSNSVVSDQKLDTGEIAYNLGTSFDADVVSGESFFITYGTKTYAVSLNSSYDYSSAEKTAESINKALENVSVGTGKTLADVMKADLTADGKMKFTNTDTATGNTLVISGSTGDLLTDLGFLNAGQKFEQLTASQIMITESGLTGQNAAQVTQPSTLAKELSGKEISFSYNGTVKWITLGDYSDSSNLDDVKGDLQTKLDEAFGKGRIKVDLTVESGKGSLSFITKTPDGTPEGKLDPSSTLAITAADRGILGSTGIFGIKSGESNRLNLSASIAESGLLTGTDTLTSEDMKISNNGKEVNLGLSADSSINDIINAINNSKELGIKVSYQSNSDKFIIQSTEQGASGKIALSGKLADVLFGTDNTIQEGKDAVILVQYAGSNNPMEITRGSNTVSVDGLNITVKGTFGYEGDTYVSGTEAVKFDAQIDSDATAKVVKEMVEAYNDALKLINSEVNQKPDRNYSPLTDEQKAEMSEKQIEKWETEAKKGLLFNDNDLRGLADSLRFIIPTSLRTTFEKMGITTSTNYSDNGKLVFDEEKFKTALSTDPDAVKEAFTASESKNSDGTTNAGGLMTSMKTIMDRYASMTGATKGILVERSGSIYAPTTVLKNGIQTQIDDIKDYIDRLKDKLSTEQDRYISQFSSLETLISQMNSQSSYLSSMFSS
jgi:flagellar hook-associated protein 2